MRILFVTHSFPRAEGDMAGAFLWRLAEGLVHRDHTVLVLAPADRGDVGAPMLGGVEVRRLRYDTPERETLAYTGTMRQNVSSVKGVISFRRMLQVLTREVSAECRGGGVHVVHAHWWIPGAIAAGRAERAGRPLVVTLHGTDVALAASLPFGERMMASVLRPATAVTAVSTYLAGDAARALGIARDRIPLTPMPLALGRTADPDAARQGAIFVGRLTRQKGVHDLLEALAILRKQGMPLELTVVGEGPERANLKAQARALGLTVTFTGVVAPEIVADHLQDKRVFILPSIREGLGLAVAEALTQGVPVVATRSGGIPDLLVDPQAGILVAPGDPKELAQAIRAVVVDDRYRVGAQRAGRILADRLSPEKVAEQFETVYRKTRATRPSTASLRN